jgi:hypothetical protein
MNERALRRVEQQLREALQGTVLNWVLDDIDAAIAMGVPEEKILRRRPQRRGDLHVTDAAFAAVGYEVIDRRELGSAEYEASRKRGTLVIATRAMTDQERVVLLLDAVRRVLVELPEMETETLKTLWNEDGVGVGRRVAETVVFEPDEGTRTGHGRTEFHLGRESTERRARVGELLADVMREVID